MSNVIGNQDEIPTQEQIRAGCYAVQCGWDDETRRRRATKGTRPVPFGLPSLRTAGWSRKIDIWVAEANED